MEPVFPTDLEVYCKTFDISFFTLKLQCIFCNNYATLTDLALFFEKKLSLIWKNKQCFTCCNRCLWLSAKYESERYFQCACKMQDLHDLLNKPLNEILVRCYYCYALLDLPSKHDLIARDKQACLVRGHWRAPCRSCLSKEFWL